MNDSSDKALIGKYIDGVATPEEKHQLAERLDASAELRAELAQLLYHEKTMADAFAASAAMHASTEVPSSFPPRRRWPWVAALGLAASILMVFGVATRFRATSIRPVFATISRLEGNATCRAGNLSRSLAIQAPVHGGDTIATGPGARLTLRLSSGGTIDLDSEAELDLPTSAGNSLRLNRGQSYFDIPPASLRGSRFPILIASGPSLSIVGTRFEAGARNGVLTLCVEEGTVRVHLPGGSTDVHALQRLEANATRILSGPAPVMISEIARWNFGQDGTPPGTVLFEDDFEKGMDRWKPVQLAWLVHEGEGVNGSRCLSATPPPLVEGFCPAAIAPVFIIRERNFMVTFDMCVDVAEADEGLARLAFFESLDPLKQINLGPVIPIQKPTLHSRTPRWVTLTHIVQGNTYTMAIGGLVIHKQVIPGPFKYVGLMLQPKSSRMTMRIDNVVIRKLPDEPPVASPDRMLFEDDFEGDLSKWEVPGIWADQVYGMGMDGSRCLRLSRATAPRNVVDIRPKFPGRYFTNFDVSFDGRIGYPGKLRPRMAAGFALNLPAGAALPKISPETIEFPGNTWLHFHATLKGFEYSYDIHQSTNCVAHRALRLETPGAIPGIDFETDDRSVYMLIDNFRIRDLDPAPTQPVTSRPAAEGGTPRD